MKFETERDAERASAAAVEYAAVRDRLNAVRKQAALADKRYGDPPRSSCICWSDIVGMLTDTTGGRNERRLSEHENQQEK